MWLFTKYGFFSVVEHRDRPDSVLVRARVRADLERLCPVVKHPVGDVQETLEADYPFRLEVSKKAWGEACALAGAEIDYGNFKDAVLEQLCHERSRVYLGVWSLLRQIEREELSYGND